jgi:hypothetical protein
VSEGDASGGGMAGGVSGDDEAVWRDLVARYEMPTDEDGITVPWPDREDLADAPTAAASRLSSAASGADRAPGEDSTADGTADEDGPPRAHATADGDGAPRADGTTDGDATADQDRTADAGRADDTSVAEKRPRQVRGAGRARVIRPATKPPAAPPAEPPAAPAGLDSPALWADADDEPDADDDSGEHYTPPPPAPLPRLDPVAKGAWTALFGGPAYLFVSTLLGWSPPGWAALLAVAAFVGGFAVIVLRMGDKPSRGDGPDNGAVV